MEGEVKIFPMGDEGLFVVQVQYQDCWLTGGARIQITCNLVIELVFMEIYVFISLLANPTV